MRYPFVVVPGLLLCAAAGAADLDRYVWEVRVSENIRGRLADSLKAELERHCLETVEKEPLAPLFVSTGLGGVICEFGKNHETLYSLALAYPHLSGAAKGKVRAFLDGYARRTNMFGSRDKMKGTRREPFRVPVSYLRHGMVGTERPCSVEPGYAMWLYAEATGNKAYAGAALGGLARRISGAGEFLKKDKTRNDPHLGNLALEGLIGTARLAALAGDGEAARRAADEAKRLMNIRLALLRDDGAKLRGFEQSGIPAKYRAEEKGSHLFRRSSTGHGGQGNRVLQFRDMVPEVARLLKENDPGTLARMTGNVDSYMPGWYIAWGERRMGQEVPHWVDGCRKFQCYVYAESFVVYPDVPHSLFMFKALIAEEPAENLDRYADVPWSTGDLFYIEKLVRAIEACGRAGWVRLKYAP